MIDDPEESCLTAHRLGSADRAADVGACAGRQSRHLGRRSAGAQGAPPARSSQHRAAGALGGVDHAVRTDRDAGREAEPVRAVGRPLQRRHLPVRRDLLDLAALRHA